MCYEHQLVKARTRQAEQNRCRYIGPLPLRGAHPVLDPDGAVSSGAWDIKSISCAPTMLPDTAGTGAILEAGRNEKIRAVPVELIDQQTVTAPTPGLRSNNGEGRPPTREAASVTP
mgnify:CR=1 FL=1